MHRRRLIAYNLLAPASRESPATWLEWGLCLGSDGALQMGKVFDRMIAVGRARSAGGGLPLWLSEPLCRFIRKKAGRRGREGEGKA